MQNSTFMNLFYKEDHKSGIFDLVRILLEIIFA